LDLFFSLHAARSLSSVAPEVQRASASFPGCSARRSRPVVSLLAVFGTIEGKEKGNRVMNEEQLSEMRRYCMNEACENYRKVSPETVMKYGRTDKGTQRYRCKTCKKTFTETKGTVLYRIRHSEEEVIECITMVSERKSLAAIHRIKGIKEETVCRWMEKIEEQVQPLEEEHRLP
jgi:transposase-like protein